VFLLAFIVKKHKNQVLVPIFKYNEVVVLWSLQLYGRTKYYIVLSTTTQELWYFWRKVVVLWILQLYGRTRYYIVMSTTSQEMWYLTCVYLLKYRLSSYELWILCVQQLHSCGSIGFYSQQETQKPIY
jgi:hypothetical protein